MDTVIPPSACVPANGSPPIVILCHGNVDTESDRQIVSVLNKLKKTRPSLISGYFPDKITVPKFRKAKQDSKKIVTIDCGGGEANPQYHPKPTIRADLTQPLTHPEMTWLNNCQLVMVVHAPLFLEQNEQYKKNVRQLLSEDGLFVIVLSDRISKSYYTVNSHFYNNTFKEMKSAGGWRGSWWHKTGFVTFSEIG